MVAKCIATNFLDKPDYETFVTIFFILALLFSIFLKEAAMNTSRKK
jgi:hypothetical protein